MTIVDTTVWIDYLAGTSNPHTRWLEKEVTRQRLGLTDVILCEVLQGIRSDATFEGVRGGHGEKVRGERRGWGIPVESLRHHPELL